jgi:hypothetical protein
VVVTPRPSPIPRVPEKFTSDKPDWTTSARRSPAAHKSIPATTHRLTIDPHLKLFRSADPSR